MAGQVSSQNGATSRDMAVYMGDKYMHRSVNVGCITYEQAVQRVALVACRPDGSPAMRRAPATMPILKKKGKVKIGNMK